jgi:hypothetical protein
MIAIQVRYNHAMSSKEADILGLDALSSYLLRTIKDAITVLEAKVE